MISISAFLFSAMTSDKRESSGRPWWSVLHHTFVVKAMDHQAQTQLCLSRKLWQQPFLNSAKLSTSESNSSPYSKSPLKWKV